MKISFFPKTRLGKWCIITMIISWGFGIVYIVSSINYDIGGLEQFMKPEIKVLEILSFVSAIISFIMGLTSVINYKERSILVCFAIIVGWAFALTSYNSIIEKLFWVRPEF